MEPQMAQRPGCRRGCCWGNGVRDSAYCLAFSTFTSTLLNFAFARIDVFIIRGGFLLRVVRTGHNLRDLLLPFIEFQLYQEFGDHREDSIQGNVGVSQLMFGVQGITDVSNCEVVLDDSTQGLNDKCNQSSRMNILSGLDAQVEPALHLFKPLRRLI